MQKSDTCTHPPVWDILHHLTYFTWLKKHPQFRRIVATTDKPSCFSLPFTLIKIESTTNWLHHMAFSEGSQPEISNKIIARSDHLDAWKAKTSSTVRAVAGSHFLLSKPWSLDRPGLHRFPHHFEKRAYLETKIRHLPTRLAVTIMW